MISKKRALLVWLIGAPLIGACGFISGHSAAMHQHASEEEINKMLLDENQQLSKANYIKKAFLDYKHMMKDPCGLNRLR